MQTKIILSLATILALVGTGCGTTATTNTASAPAAGTITYTSGGTTYTVTPGAAPTAQTNGQTSAAAAYDQAVDIPVDPSMQANNAIIQGLVEGVIGKVKVISINSLGANNFNAEYQASRNTTANDLIALTQAIRSKGYTINDTSAAEGGAMVVGVDKADNTLTIQFQIGASVLDGALMSATQ